MINELKLFEQLEESFFNSTLEHNSFAEALDSVEWDARFYEDGEHYFVKGGLIFTTPSLDPFQITKDWMPSAVFSDGGQLEFS